MAQDDREYEFKFSVAPDNVPRLLEHSLIAQDGKPHVAHLVSTYFDTPDFHLRDRKVALRIRRHGENLIQTLKCAADGMMARHEWETQVEKMRPDVAALQKTPLKSLFKKEAVRDALAETFTVDVQRTILPIYYGGAEIEGALDQGEIRTNAGNLALHEFEIELKSGPPQALEDLAFRLATDLPLTLDLASKAERGFAVLDGSWGQPSKAMTIELDDDMSPAAAFQAVTQACLHSFLRNVALIAGPERVEATHKARIALRRLRAAFDLFKPILKRNRFDRLNEKVKAISKVLGAARDADVFQTGTFDKATGPGAALLAEAMRSRQNEAHRILQDALAAREWRIALLDLLAFTSEGVRQIGRHGGYIDFIRPRLARRRERLVKLSRDLKILSSDERHDVRKRAKMLRYGLGFFEEVSALKAGKRAFRHLQESLEELQETLGEMHDHDALRDYIGDDVLAGHAPEGIDRDGLQDAVAAAQRLLQDGAPAPELLYLADKAARRLAKSDPF